MGRRKITDEEKELRIKIVELTNELNKSEISILDYISTQTRLERELRGLEKDKLKMQEDIEDYEILKRILRAANKN